MQSIIKELWYGNIAPQEDGIFNKPQFKELMGYMAGHLEAFENSMSEEQKQLHEKFMDSRNEFDSLAETEVFWYGFRLGARLMLEMVSEES